MLVTLWVLIPTSVSFCSSTGGCIHFDLWPWISTYRQGLLTVLFFLSLFFFETNLALRNVAPIFTQQCFIIPWGCICLSNSMLPNAWHYFMVNTHHTFHYLVVLGWTPWLPPTPPLHSKKKKNTHNQVCSGCQWINTKACTTEWNDWRRSIFIINMHPFSTSDAYSICNRLNVYQWCTGAQVSISYTLAWHLHTHFKHLGFFCILSLILWNPATVSV